MAERTVLLRGTTEVGTMYELHWTSARPFFGKKRSGFELLEKRPGCDRFERGPGMHGPLDRPRVIRVLTSVQCDDPAETFVLGELPGSATSVLIEFPDGRRVRGEVGAEQADGFRVFVVASPGTGRPSSFEVFDNSGTRLLKERFVTGLPSPNQGGTIFATQQHELPIAGDTAKSIYGGRFRGQEPQK